MYSWILVHGDSVFGYFDDADHGYVFLGAVAGTVAAVHIVAPGIVDVVGIVAVVVGTVVAVVGTVVAVVGTVFVVVVHIVAVAGTVAVVGTVVVVHIVVVDHIAGTVDVVDVAGLLVSAAGDSCLYAVVVAVEDSDFYVVVVVEDSDLCVPDLVLFSAS